MACNVGLRLHSSSADPIASWIRMKDTISVETQSTLGEQDIFARKYMHENARKINKIPEFYMIYARKKINKMPEFYMIFARKIYFARIWGEGASASLPPVSYAYERHEGKRGGGREGEGRGEERRAIWNLYLIAVYHRSTCYIPLLLSLASKGVGTAGATGALAPAVLKPRGRKCLFAAAIIYEPRHKSWSE